MAPSETGSGAPARRAHVIADGYSEPGIDVIIKSLGSDCGSVAGVMSADDVLSVLALLPSAGVAGCLSAEQQVYLHQGYEPKDRDRHDMAQLRAAFGVDTPF